MIMEWFKANDAAALGAALADHFAPHPKSAPSVTPGGPKVFASAESIQALMSHADRDTRALKLNFFKKAKLANSFKWRLLENGVDKETADQVTKRLLTHLSGDLIKPGLRSKIGAAPHGFVPSGDIKSLFRMANKNMSTGFYAEAIDMYTQVLKSDPKHAAALNNRGAALCRLGRFNEAEMNFRNSLQRQPNFTDAYSNLGNVLLLKGQYAAAESYLRRALKLNPRFAGARINLGFTLAYTTKLRDARTNFAKALKLEPRNAAALHGMALVEKLEGNFDVAATMLDRALQINPKMAGAVASQAGLRKMTTADAKWLNGADALVNAGLSPYDESELRFAMGKYFDDIGDFKGAFSSYKRANELLKAEAVPYDRTKRSQFVDEVITAYTKEKVAGSTDGSTSNLPVFIIGMPRSGTSLTEQIISSHPSAKGAGEVEFWSDVASQHDEEVRTGTLNSSTKAKLAHAYLGVLEQRAGKAMRIIDKSPVNADHVGLIHSVFPNARFIYMRRDPIDTCLSCYFQKFVLSLNYTMDLGDLADYYLQHERLMNHWRSIMQPGALLDVPYEDLVTDQMGWTRKILTFLDLEWDDKVLDFHNTKRAVATASFWQVRQKIYNDSVQRWRHYEKLIGPLLTLKD